MAETLRDRLQQRLREVGDQDDGCAAATLRLILTAIRERDRSLHDDGRSPLDDDAIRALLAQMVAHRRDEIGRCERFGQLTMAEREAREIAVISDFLPQPLDSEETAAVVDAVISETAANDLRDTGRVVAKLKERYPGRLDLKEAKRLICERLH